MAAAHTSRHRQVTHCRPEILRIYEVGSPSGTLKHAQESAPLLPNAMRAAPTLSPPPDTWPGLHSKSNAIEKGMYEEQ